jgi:hypothetical protein
MRQSNQPWNNGAASMPIASSANSSLSRHTRERLRPAGPIAGINGLHLFGVVRYLVDLPFLEPSLGGGIFESGVSGAFAIALSIKRA